MATMTDSAEAPPARIDWSSLHGKLYDRDESISQLSDAYERCLQQANQEREIVLITGSSGAGKTALAASLKDRVSTVDHGFFLTGKFDEVAATNKSTAINSYLPFSDAVADYSFQVRKLGDDFVESVKQSLEESMSSDELLVLLESFPPLTTLLHSPTRRREDSSSPRRIVLRGADAESRFVTIVCKFFQTISSQGYPIVMLLDDMQWANSSSLALLKAIASLEKEIISCRLMLICTCQNTDGDSLSLLRSSLREGGLTIVDIEAANLSLKAVQDLVLDAVLIDDATVTSSLAETLHSQTQGNAFHVLQLLKALDEDDLLKEPGRSLLPFYYGNVPSVMNLLNKRIHRLPEKVRELLKVAACLGTVFSDKCLQAGVYFPTSQVVSAIQMSEEEGIIVRGNDPKTFRFIHDLFRYATYKMIPEGIKDAFHLNIGRRLWHWLPKEDRDEYLMLIADQISRGISLIKEPDERDELARAFLQAGHKSAMASSFSAAAAYLKYGIDLLGPNKWTCRYELSLTLYNTAAEMEYYCGNFLRVDELTEEILKGARTFEDTLLARFTEIYCLGSREEMSRALDEGLKVLKCLGEKFPRRISAWRIKWELKRCKWLFHNFTEEHILQLPRLADTKKLTAMRLMNILHTFAFFVGDPCGAVLAARAVKMTLQHGVNEMSCAGFANLGLVYATLGDVEEAYRCSQTAVHIFEFYRAREWKGRLVFATYAFVFPLKRPLRQLIDHLLDGHQAALISGDISLSMLSAFIYCLLRLYAGDPIPQVLNAAQTYRKLASQYSQHIVISHFDILIQFCYNMMGESDDPLVLQGSTFNEIEALKVWENTNPVLLMALHVWKHFLAVYLGEFQAAAVLANKTNTINAKLVPLTLNTHLFLQAVASASLSQGSRHHQRQTSLFLTKLRGFEKHSPENYSHKVLLVEAELSSRMGNHHDALRKYNSAIEHAKNQGFIHEQALACERAGYTSLQCGRNTEAKCLITQASVLYKEWGAQVKVDQLELVLTSCS